MLRCAHCGEHALAGLAHLHGDPCRPLCRHCTDREVKQKARELEQHKSHEEEFARTPSMAA